MSGPTRPKKFRVYVTASIYTAAKEYTNRYSTTLPYAKISDMFSEQYGRSFTPSPKTFNRIARSSNFADYLVRTRRLQEDDGALKPIAPADVKLPPVSPAMVPGDSLVVEGLLVIEDEVRKTNDLLLRLLNEFRNAWGKK